MEITHVAEDGDSVTVTWEMTKEEYAELMFQAEEELDNGKE